MILRFVESVASAADVEAMLREMRDATPVARRDSGYGTLAAVRDEADRWALVVMTLARGMSAVRERTGGRPRGPIPRIEREGLASSTVRHYDLQAGPGLPDRLPRSGTVGMITLRLASSGTEQALEMIERQRDVLLASGEIHGFLVGRTSAGDRTELAAIALWRSRDGMRTFLTERAEGPGIDRRFVSLAESLRFATFEIADPARPLPALGVPAALVLDDRRVYVDASPGVEHILGVPAEMVLGRRADEIRPPRDADGISERWAAFLSAGRADGVVDLVRPDGTEVRVRYQSIANVPRPGLNAAVIQPAGAEPVDDVEETVRRALGGWRVVAHADGREPRAPDAQDRQERAASGRAPHPGSQSPPGRLAHLALVTVPSGDVLFARYVAEVAEALGGWSSRRLQLHLRALYPNAVVHPREIDQGGGESWYVFRDGRLRREATMAWWEGASFPWATLEPSGRIVDADERLARLFGLPREELIGRDLSELGIRGSEEDLSLLLRFAFEVGTSHSTLRLRSRSDRELVFAFRGQVIDGRLHVIVRPLAPAEASAARFAPICLPTWDEAFVARVEDVFASLAPGDPAERSRQVEARLRARYPRAVVRPLEGVLGFGPMTDVLVVYRDGEQSPYAEPWWDRRGAARIATTRGRLTDLNAAAAAMLGWPRARLLGAPIERLNAFGVPENDRWLRDILDRTGVLHATTLMRRGDGSVIEVEYRSTRDAIDPSRIVSVLRRVPESQPRASATKGASNRSPVGALSLRHA